MSDPRHTHGAPPSDSPDVSVSNQASGKRFSPASLSDRLASPLLRCGFIGIVTFLLLIPLDFVRGIIRDRSYLQREATENIAASWGKAQTVSGPILIVPYEVWHERREVVKEKGTDKEREVVHREYSTRYKAILPTDVHFDARLDPEIRYRGIYRLALFNAPVSIRGSFTLPETGGFAKNIHAVHWGKAWLAMGITDLKTISEDSPMQWAGVAAAAYKPGTRAGNILGPGFHAAVPMTEKAAGAKQEFSIQLKVRGSGGISFTPVGENTLITIAGTWADPSFQGNLLPVERSITEKGFSAKWVISNLTRTYPQIGELEGSDFTRSPSSDRSAITGFTTGVDLHEAVSLYRMVMRAVQYGILFIAVSFVALFAFEMVTRQRMHLLQYGMVGLSMSLFYLVLLSLAEHVAFGIAFAAASTVTVGMNSLYIASALQSASRGLLMCALLSGLYALLFCLLRMEDVALLVGTGLVIAMMGVLMYVTRKLPQSRT